MKKLVCMALSAALLAGSVPAYAADYITKVPHTFTARVGTTEFTKDGAAQPLDVPIYIKDGYTMLPLRTFMKAALGEKSQMAWDNETKAATVAFGGNLIRFSVKENTIAKKREGLTCLGQNGSEGWARFRSPAELVGYFAVHRLSHRGGRYHMGQHHKAGNRPRCGTEA